jgi:hypothetical protein
MIDKPDRKEPRFPPEKEPEARMAIKEAVQNEKQKAELPLIGIAGGACGGDILFHEVCDELGISTELYLALPREKFLDASVRFAGPDWVKRFDRLYHKLPVKVLARQEEEELTVWEQSNLWMLKKALSFGGQHMTLIALWDGKGGDGPGGTEHLVSQTKKSGGRVVIIDSNQL